MRRSIPARFAVSILALAAPLALAEDPPVHDAGAAAIPVVAHAPAHADDGFSEGACATGAQQSPIDLSSAIPTRTAAPHPQWATVKGGVVQNTGHTIQVDMVGGGSVRLGEAYTLKQVHFHHPSEHTLDGKSYPLEAHFVHQAADGRLAVIGVLFEEGAYNPTLERIWATAPGRTGKAIVGFEIDPWQLAPASGPAYRYEGSLTTPPCTESVSWTVMAQPMTASHSQIAAFAALFPNNARGVQPLNRRYVLKTE